MFFIPKNYCTLRTKIFRLMLLFQTNVWLTSPELWDQHALSLPFLIFYLLLVVMDGIYSVL